MKSHVDSSYLLKLISLIVILPLLFVLLGGWQTYRTRHSDVTEQLAKIDATIAAVRQIQQQAKNPNVTVKNSSGKSYTASMVVSQLQREKNELRSSYGMVATFGLPLSVLVMIFGLSGALVGGLGLATIYRMGQKALTSRDALLQSFRSGQKLLPWLIGAVGLCIALALACGLAFELLRYASTGLKGRGDTKLIVYGVVAVIAMFFFAGKLIWNVFQSSKAVFERDPMRLMGHAVSEKEAPKVWSFVRGIAEKAGAVMPDGIILGLDEGFFVTEHPVALVSEAPAPQGRILYMPLPYMAFMSKEEAAAVIGHELGHFTGADTEYSLHFSPIYAAAVRNLQAVDQAAEGNSSYASYLGKPAIMLGEFFLRSFDLAVQHWSRIREFAADAVGASVASNQAIGLSLLRISVLWPHINTALAECWNKGGKLEGGIIQRVRDLVKEQGLSDPAQHLEDAQPHPTDSHPTVRQRLEALGVEADAAFMAKAQSREGSTLLRELGLTEEQTSGSEGCADSPNPSLSRALEAEFTQMAKDNVESQIGALQQAAALGTERREFWEGGVVGLTALIIVGVILLGVGFLGFMEGLSNNTFLLWLLPLGGLGMLGYAVYFSKRRKKPFIIFTGQGFLVADLTSEIPWTAVDDYGITVNTQNGFTTSVVIDMEMADGCEVPNFSGDRRIKYKKKESTLRITIGNLRGRMTVEEFSEQLATHWHGGLARARLAAME